MATIAAFDENTPVAIHQQEGHQTPRSSSSSSSSSLSSSLSLTLSPSPERTPSSSFNSSTAKAPQSPFSPLSTSTNTSTSLSRSSPGPAPKPTPRSTLKKKQSTKNKVKGKGRTNKSKKAIINPMASVQMTMGGGAKTTQLTKPSKGTRGAGAVGGHAHTLAGNRRGLSEREEVSERQQKVLESWMHKVELLEEERAHLKERVEEVEGETVQLKTEIEALKESHYNTELSLQEEIEQLKEDKRKGEAALKMEAAAKESRLQEVLSEMTVMEQQVDGLVMDIHSEKQRVAATVDEVEKKDQALDAIELQLVTIAALYVKLSKVLMGENTNTSLDIEAVLKMLREKKLPHKQWSDFVWSRYETAADAAPPPTLKRSLQSSSSSRSQGASKRRRGVAASRLSSTTLL